MCMCMCVSVCVCVYVLCVHARLPLAHQYEVVPLGPVQSGYKMALCGINHILF